MIVYAYVKPKMRLERRTKGYQRLHHILILSSLLEWLDLATKVIPQMDVFKIKFLLRAFYKPKSKNAYQISEKAAELIFFESALADAIIVHFSLIGWAFSFQFWSKPLRGTSWLKTSFGLLAESTFLCKWWGCTYPLHNFSTAPLYTRCASTSLKSSGHLCGGLSFEPSIRRLLLGLRECMIASSVRLMATQSSTRPKTRVELVCHKPEQIVRGTGKKWGLWGQIQTQLAFGFPYQGFPPSYRHYR